MRRKRSEGPAASRAGDRFAVSRTVISISCIRSPRCTILHCYDLDKALREMQRVGKEHRYLCVESYRTEEEKANLLYWQVTCEAFNTPEEWDWWFKQTGYTGDHSFIFFE